MNLRERILEQVPQGGITAKGLWLRLSTEDPAMADCALGAMVRDRTLRLIGGLYYPGRRPPEPAPPKPAPSPRPAAHHPQPKARAPSAPPPVEPAARPEPIAVSRAALSMLEEMRKIALAEIQQHERQVEELQRQIDQHRSRVAWCRAHIALLDEVRGRLGTESSPPQKGTH